MSENKSATFFGSGTLDSNPPKAAILVGDVAPDPAIVAISPTSIGDSVAFTLTISGVGFLRRHTPTQVRIEAGIATEPVNAGATDSLLTATFSAGLTPDAAYDVFVDFTDGTSLQSPTQITVTP